MKRDSASANSVNSEQLIEILRRSNPIFVQLHRNLQRSLSEQFPASAPATKANN